jgi:hypothetical protein
VLLVAAPERLADTGLRARLVGIRLIESSDLWDAVYEARRCHVAIIDGDITEARATSLARLLRHRHPGLSLLVRCEHVHPRDVWRVHELGGAFCPRSAGGAVLAAITRRLIARAAASTAA